MNQQLMQLLSDGQFHSGEEIGQLLGVSRAAVWKQLKKLETMNIPVHSVKGRGYRLPEAVDLLIPEKLSEHGLNTDLFDSIDIALSIDSTNSAMTRLAEQQGSGRHLIFAEMQTQGRGRRGRQWVSPFARNLYFSVLWTFEQGIGAIQGLSLAVGLSIHHTLKNMGIDQVGLKWPNDVLVQQNGQLAKLGGILIEITGDLSDQCQVVIGVGLNLDIQHRDLAHIDQAAVGVKQLGVTIDRNAFAANLLVILHQTLEAFTQTGFAPIQPHWNEADAFKNTAVKLILPSSEVQGIAKGVNEKGELQLDVDGKMHVYNGGEVSLRLQD